MKCPAVRPLLLASVIAIEFIACAPSTTAERAAKDGWPRFGTADETIESTVPISSLGESTNRVAVEGTVFEVCQSKGCWMTLRGSDHAEVLVRFRDYSIFVPRNATGRHAIVWGRAERETLSIEMLRQLARDSGKSDATIAAIRLPKDSLTLIADSVRIQGPGLVDVYRPIGAESYPAFESATK